MATEKQIAANRKNGRKSQGPSTLQGMTRSRSNALRHGLAIDIGQDLMERQTIRMLAASLSIAEGDSKITDPAFRVALAELDLVRIKKTRAVIFDEMYCQSPDKERSRYLSVNLASIERYETRAFSRRKRALRELDRLRRKLPLKYRFCETVCLCFQISAERTQF